MASRLNVGQPHHPAVQREGEEQRHGEHERHLEDQEDAHPGHAAQEQRVGQGPA